MRKLLSVLMLSLALSAMPISAAPKLKAKPVVARVVSTNDEKLEALKKVDSTLNRFITWGLNPKSLTLNDFEVEFEVVKGDNKGGVGVGDKTYMKVTYPLTGKSQSYDVWLIVSRGAYPAAVDILHLAEKSGE